MSFLGFKASWPFRKKKNPLVTILMPCKDPHPGFLKAAVRSVLDQTSSGWQLIIIGEKNEILALQELMLSFKTHPRISIIINESRLLSGALNTGMRAASGDFICILLVDDMLAPNAIEVLSRYIRSCPDVDFFHSARRIINENGEFISRVYPSRKSFALSDFKHGSPVKHLLCWKREKGLAIGGIDEDLGIHGADDYDFPWSMAEAGCNFKAIPECLYYYRDHREHYRLTTHVPLDQQKEELTKIFRKHGLSPDEIRAELDSRSAGYLRQALFADEEDKIRKERVGFDAQLGWREGYGDG